MDFWISDWISGFHSGFLDFWISQWISGFQFGFLPTVYEISFVTDPSRPRDMGLLNKYSLGHCGLSAASRHKFAFISRHYALLTATDTTALYQTPFLCFYLFIYFLFKSI